MKRSILDTWRLRAGFEWLALEPEQLHELAKDPAYDFTEAFLSDALAKGDRCYGILDGDVLATYGWYSTNPTETSDDVTLHFNSDYVYMYKGYTLPQYRGRRLYAVAINRALSEYLARGYHGLVSYIESNNFSSLKSVRRLGYHSFGHVIVLEASWTALDCHESGMSTVRILFSPHETRRRYGRRGRRAGNGLGRLTLGAAATRNDTRWAPAGADCLRPRRRR